MVGLPPQLYVYVKYNKCLKDPKRPKMPKPTSREGKAIMSYNNTFASSPRGEAAKLRVRCCDVDDVIAKRTLLYASCNFISYTEPYFPSVCRPVNFTPLRFVKENFSCRCVQMENWALALEQSHPRSLHGLTSEAIFLSLRDRSDGAAISTNGDFREEFFLPENSFLHDQRLVHIAPKHRRGF